MPETIYSIGHSNRSLPDFIGILKAHHIAVVIDIRSIPRSRHNPRFNQETLADALANARIRYVHCADLGGFRTPKNDSVNTAWTSRAFHGFADYMQTPKFADAVGRLIDLAKREIPVMMCAEGNPYRCHRRLIADALQVQGVPVVHITSLRSRKVHTLTSFARVKDGKIFYPAMEAVRNEEKVRSGRVNKRLI